MKDPLESQAQPPAPGPSLLRDLVALTKPRITFMVLVTTLGGLFLAPERPSLSITLFALLGTALVVGSANTLNCWLERDVDRYMTRTKNRPLPAGRLAAFPFHRTSWRSESPLISTAST